MTLQIAALASGTGTNVQAIFKAIEQGRLDARIALVLSNKPDAPVLDKARAWGVPVRAADHRDFTSREAFDQGMLAHIREAGADTVVLAGYMRILSAAFIQAFPGRTLNIHPALLPAFPGAHAGQDALDYGVRISGVTVHFVDEIMDNGPIIVQAAVPVDPSAPLDELMARIHALEHRIFPQALQWLAEERLTIEGRRVILRPRESASPCSVSQGAGGWMVVPALEDF